MQRFPMESLKRPVSATPQSSSAFRASEMRLLAIDGVETKLYVLSGEGFRDSKVIQTGDFRTSMLVVAGSPVAVVTCQVGDHRWMLARDSLALRVGSAAFLFSFQGFIYGLSLPPHCVGAQAKLAEILAEFSAYQDIYGDQVEPGTDAEVWALSYAKVEHLRCRLQRLPPAVPSPARSAALLSRKVDKAMRSSAITKLVSRAFLTGLLHPSKHLHLSTATAAGSPPLSFPSFRTCSDLVDAMENGFRPSASSTVPALQMHGGAGTEAKSGYWWLNADGVTLLVGVITAYTKGNNNNSNNHHASKRMKMSYDAVVRMRMSGGACGAGGGYGGANGGIGMSR